MNNCKCGKTTTVVYLRFHLFKIATSLHWYASLRPKMEIPAGWWLGTGEEDRDDDGHGDAGRSPPDVGDLQNRGEDGKEMEREEDSGADGPATADCGDCERRQ